MQVGDVLPSYEIPCDPITQAHFAVTVEQLGYAHLAVIDNVRLSLHPLLDDSHLQSHIEKHL